MQSSGDIWRWYRDRKVAFPFYLSIGSKFGLEVTLFLPPSVPSRLYDLGYVSLVILIVKRLEDYPFSVRARRL